MNEQRDDRRISNVDTMSIRCERIEIILRRGTREEVTPDRSPPEIDEANIEASSELERQFSESLREESSSGGRVGGKDSEGKSPACLRGAVTEYESVDSRGTSENERRERPTSSAERDDSSQYGASVRARNDRRESSQVGSGLQQSTDSSFSRRLLSRIEGLEESSSDDRSSQSTPGQRDTNDG